MERKLPLKLRIKRKKKIKTVSCTIQFDDHNDLFKSIRAPLCNKILKDFFLSFLKNFERFKFSNVKSWMKVAAKIQREKLDSTHSYRIWKSSTPRILAPLGQFYFQLKNHRISEFHSSKGEGRIGDFPKNWYLCETRITRYSKILENKHGSMIFSCRNHRTFCKQMCP